MYMEQKFLVFAGISALLPAELYEGSLNDSDKQAPPPPLLPRVKSWLAQGGPSCAITVGGGGGNGLRSSP